MLKAVALITICLLPCVIFSMVQHAQATAFVAQFSTNNTGAAQYNFTGSLHFEHTLDDLRNAGDSSTPVYIVTIKFKEGLRPVKTGTGFENMFAEDKQELTINKAVKLSVHNTHDYELNFSIPVSAFSLAEGNHTVNAFVSVIEENTQHSIMPRQKVLSFELIKLPEQRVRLWVKYILADSVDAKGEMWDYFVGNPHESNPDITWCLNYAGQTYYKSKTAKNSFEFLDYKHQQYFDFTISKGDTISIAVKDIDEWTADDLIGTIIIATQNAIQDSAITIARAGQVKRLAYQLTLLP